MLYRAKGIKLKKKKELLLCLSFNMCSNMLENMIYVGVVATPTLIQYTATPYCLINSSRPTEKAVSLPRGRQIQFVRGDRSTSPLQN